MTNKKKNGVYYTPNVLADFMVNYIIDNFDLNNNLNILEPSCGDGIFLKYLFSNSDVLSKDIKIDIIEINSKELKKSLERINRLKTNSVEVKDYNIDYLEYNTDTKYDIVIGNPPYITRKYLSEKQIKLCEKMLSKMKISNKKIMNIWIYFLLRAVSQLKKKGVLFFVLPAEILQVSYAKNLRKYLNEEFDQIKIFGFDQLIFDNIEQDVILFLGIKFSSIEGISFELIDNLEDLKKGDSLPNESLFHVKSNEKWTKYILSSEELNLIDNLKNKLKLKKVSDMCNSSTGIVTGANKFFIVTNDIIKKYNLKKFALPILKRSFYLPNNSVMLTNEDFDIICSEGKDCNLLYFDKEDINQFEDKVRIYLNKGIDEGINERYKCSRRKLWYKVPNIWKSEGVFFKRSHLYPKIIVNEANLLVTDTAYRIKMKDTYDIKSLIFSFYNSLTLTFAELDGRFYGGGVLEIIPSEFKGLLLPYIKIDDIDFNTLDKMFREGKNINEILEYTNEILLLKKLGLDKVTLKKIEIIRKKLLYRRIKN